MNFSITTHEPRIPTQKPRYKRGEFVTIIKYGDNPYNIYKGYTAEVIKYNKDDDYIVVNIEALYRNICLHINQIQYS
jgi:hypothetical protein